MAGVKGIRAKKEESFIRRLFSRIRVLECDLKAIEESSDIAVKLAMIGREINALDVLIAGIALADEAEKIVTKDKHFIEIEKNRRYQINNILETWHNLDEYQVLL